MIVVDTSALVAVVLNEPRGEACAIALRDEERILLSAGTLAEAFSVAARRAVLPDMLELIEQLDCEIVSLTEAAARRVGEAYQRWGRGFHPAGLNFGDCFAYVLAKEQSSRLLYVGDDFAKTDIEGALPPC